MNSKILTAAAFSVALCGASSLEAAELLLTAGSDKSGGVSMIAVDVLTDGDARGVQARIAVPKGAKVDTTKCLSALPAGFQGVCELRQGEVRLMAFAFGDHTLPAGLVELGTIKVSGQALGQAELGVEDFQVVDSGGRSLPSESTVSAGRAGERRPTNEKAR